MLKISYTVVKSMSLTELMIRQARPEEKPYMLSDGKGLSLEVRPNGKKYWIIRYWIAGKERRSSAGAYPDVTLREARDKNYEFRKSLKDGKPIGFETENFATVAAEWLEKRMSTKAESYLRTIRLRLDRIVLPAIGHMKLRDITSGIVLQLCRRIEARGTLETADRVKTLIGPPPSERPPVFISLFSLALGPSGLTESKNSCNFLSMNGASSLPGNSTQSD
jgi:hypothetical protein